jgi:hypothetical protein
MRQSIEAVAKKSNFRKLVYLTLSRADASDNRVAVTREEIECPVPVRSTRSEAVSGSSTSRK